MRDASDDLLLLGDFATGGVPAFHYADGSCGIRGIEGATVLPSAITLAASWNKDLAGQYGSVLGAELIASGHNAILAPALDIARDPRSGRIGENLGEDPMLAGELGGAMVRGIQAHSALAFGKHYVGNNIERLRTGEGSFSNRTPAIDVRVDDRTLHEVYLEPFRRAVQNHGMAGLLGSYNQLNGEYVCQSRRLLSLPYDDWGFVGATVPDAIFAVRDTREALHAGLDLGALGDGSSDRTLKMIEGLESSRVAELAGHVRGAARAVQLIEPTRVIDAPRLATPSALQLAERVAIDGAVLLKNDGTLPLDLRKSVALIGASSLHHRLTVGGAAAVSLTPSRIPMIRNELERAGVSVVAESLGAPHVINVPLRAHDGMSITATIERDGVTTTQSLDTAELRATDDAPWAAEVTIERERAESLLVTIDVAGEVIVEVGGRTIASGFREASPMIAGPAYPLQFIASGNEPIFVRYRTAAAIVVPGLPVTPHLAIGAEPLEPLLTQALDAAREADITVMLAGRVTGEAMDAESLELPPGEAAILEALITDGRQVVMITHGAGPIVMPWRSTVAAILHLGHPGERAASAIAAILTGSEEPGGRLVLSVPASDQLPIPPEAAAPDANGLLFYSDGVDIGYRAYERYGRQVAYPFGFGLGYATITAGQPVPISSAVKVPLTCGDDRGGKAVIQLYARVRPDETLKLVGWTTTTLGAGTTHEVVVAIDREALRIYDTNTRQWVDPVRAVEVQVGFSRMDPIGVVTVDLA